MIADLLVLKVSLTARTDAKVLEAGAFWLHDTRSLALKLLYSGRCKVQIILRVEHVYKTPSI